MTILFPTISSAIQDINNRGIYPDLIRKFVSEGHQVYVIFPSDRSGTLTMTESGNIKLLGVPFFKITKASLLERTYAMLRISSVFSAAVERNFPDVKFDLILYSTPPVTFNRLLQKFKKKHKAFTYLMLKDIFPQNAVDLGLLNKSGIMYKHFRRSEKELYKLSDFIGCMSPANVSYVSRAEGPLVKNKIGICPNAIEIQRRPFTKSQKIAVRQKNNLPSDKTLVVYGGNLGRPQGVEFLLEIIKEFSNDPKVHFLICGSGTETHKVADFIDESELSNVTFFEGLGRDVYEDLEASADIALVFLNKAFTIPNFPSRILSYMEHALPILFSVDSATDVGKVAEEGSFGIATQYGDMEEFSNKLLHLEGNPELRDVMGKKGLDYLKKHFTTDEAYRLIISKIDHVSNN